MLVWMVIFFTLTSCSRHKPLDIQMVEPRIENINLNKEEISSHIRSVISEFFVSGKTVVDNIDPNLGIIQVNFIVDMGDSIQGKQRHL